MLGGGASQKDDQCHSFYCFFKSFLRELFVDKNRAVGVTMGETDNKKALDQRKKQLLKEKRKYGLAEEDESQISWEIYYNKVI